MEVTAMMCRTLKASMRAACSLLLFVMAPAGLAATVGVPGELAAGLARYALATDRVAPALGLADSIKGESASFLGAQLLLSSGRTDQGLAELRQVANGQHHRAEAALILGRHLLAGDQPSEAEQWLGKAVRFGFGETRQQASYELAELARRAGRTDRAGRILAGMEEGYWAAVGYLNLSSDYAREDLNPSRALVALRVALAMAEKDGVGERSRHLKSRLLVRAGYLAYQNGEHDKAIGFLDKIPLDSYSTPQALYLHGLALAAKGNHRASMQSWHRAKKYPLAYPGVAEAWIGMGRGFDLSGYLGQAGEAYLAANAAYESERVTLRKLADRIRQQGAYKTLVEDARDSDLEWFLADSRTLTQPRMAYLLEFVEHPNAQKSVRRVADLVQLARTLERQKGDLAVFIQALEDQLATLGTERGGAASTLKKKQESLETALERLAGANLSAEQKRQMRRMSETLSMSAKSLKELGSRIQKRPSVLRQQLRQARALKAQTTGLQDQLARLRQQSEERLNRRALDFVAEQDRQMAFSLDKTEQQIAHLYEYLALENLQETKP
ncbi:tetratricopeptide repeat protein [Marinobacter sp. F4218]|uniref:tetratricopeptide repeat protein n=1 Tax=Marinobacter sp. F4218 TaxID=2862868 RepID=UPI001C627B6B|nr:hypothetical protein [Marinobacter sp. F4218]MBW7470025.1 hypothetical protein [Marinobacter sp. F4218]